MRKQRKQRKGFTLVELLVVIGIIAVLISILLPSLSRARASADRIKCANNLRQVALGMLVYINENNGMCPAAYNYRDQQVIVDPATGLKMEAGLQDPTKNATKSYGYIHWSSYLDGQVPPEAFQCPSIPNGGLGATLPNPKDLIPGQTVSIGSDAAAVAAPTNQVLQSLLIGVPFISTPGYYPDAQAPRMAYTLNEAVFCRPKYAVGFDGTLNPSRNVNIAEIRNPSGTIMATEYASNWSIVSGRMTSGGAATVCKSHRPVHGFRVNDDTGGNPVATDLDKVPASGCDLGATDTKTTGAGGIRRVVSTDLWRIKGGFSADLESDADIVPAVYGDDTRMTKLDLVGRNHPGEGSLPRDNVTNFVYMDGHVETKSVLKTIPQQLGQSTAVRMGRQVLFTLDPQGSSAVMRPIRSRGQRPA